MEMVVSIKERNVKIELDTARNNRDIKIKIAPSRLLGPQLLVIVMFESSILFS